MSTALQYEPDGAIRAAKEVYRTAIGAGNDPVDLANPLAISATNRGLQAIGPKQNIIVSIRFNAPADSCDVYLVSWSEKDGTMKALCAQRALGVVPGVLRESAAGAYLSEEPQFFDGHGARWFEVRFMNVVGTIEAVVAWSF